MKRSQELVNNNVLHFHVYTVIVWVGFPDRKETVFPIKTVELEVVYFAIAVGVFVCCPKQVYPCL